MSKRITNQLKAKLAYDISKKCYKDNELIQKYSISKGTLYRTKKLQGDTL